MEQNGVWLLVGLFAVSIPLIALAKRVNVAYPIVLVAGGLLLGFIPHLPQITLDPNLVLVIFLPPLLYWEGITAPTDVMRANAGQIWVLAIGLVLATAAIVAAVAHAIIPGMTWAIAFVLGAIVAPTDELASAPVLESFRMPRHLIAIVEGESLLNDASSLILYAFAISAAVSGVFNLGLAAIEFFAAGAGGILVGLLVGRLAVLGWRRYKDTQLQLLIAINLPYLAYSFASRFLVSGVLAVVFAAIYANRFTPRLLTVRARLQGRGFWDSIVFLVNVVLFELLGLQLHGIAHAVFQEYSVWTVLWYAVIVNLAVIGVRFAWLLGQEYVPGVGAAYEHPSGDWKHAMIAAWSGLRGAVSLAAALAIPLTTAAGAQLPYRNLVIFLTFSVILVTLVAGGMTLPLLIRWLEVSEDSSEEDQEIRRGLLGMSRAALEELDAVEKEGHIPRERLQRLRKRYEHQRDHADGHPAEEDAIVDLERRLLEVEQQALIDMRERGEIDNTVLRLLQRGLDISQERLGVIGGS